GGGPEARVLDDPAADHDRADVEADAAGDRRRLDPGERDEELPAGLAHRDRLVGLAAEEMVDVELAGLQVGAEFGVLAEGHVEGAGEARRLVLRPEGDDRLVDTEALAGQHERTLAPPAANAAASLRVLRRIDRTADDQARKDRLGGEGAGIGETGRAR